MEPFYLCRGVGRHNICLRICILCTKVENVWAMHFCRTWWGGGGGKEGGLMRGGGLEPHRGGGFDGMYLPPTVGIFFVNVDTKKNIFSAL